MPYEAEEHQKNCGMDDRNKQLTLSGSEVPFVSRVDRVARVLGWGGVMFARLVRVSWAGSVVACRSAVLVWSGGVLP